MKLPNAARVLVPRSKIHGYLLSPTHPEGRHKAVFFRALGYNQGNWRMLALALRVFTEQDVDSIRATEFGKSYVIKGVIAGVNGRMASIVTVWAVLQGEEVPRFVTAYPEG